MTRAQLLPLARRTVEIDYRYKHRHLQSSLTALPIIAEIYEKMQPKDVFVLSKGHACAAWYAVLESKGFKPDVSKVHPERDIANGITNTAGSLGHGLPIAVGLAYANRSRQVHVLMGDGECQEGTTWESIWMAIRFNLPNLHIHIDCNSFQGCEDELYSCSSHLFHRFENYHTEFHIIAGKWNKPRFQLKLCRPMNPPLTTFFPSPQKNSVHLLTESDYEAIMKELQ